jgi:protein-disulfide isomerase
MNGELKMQLTQVNATYKWTEDEKIAYTPTFFINSYQLPENYNVSDLKYFLSV